MAERTSYLFIVSMDVAPDKEALFDEVYDTEHVPAILSVPGVTGATRYRVEPCEIPIGGRTKHLPDPSEPRYHAVYELEDPAVMQSAAWAEAAESGRWPGEVRPFTRNRRHVLLKRIAPS